MLCTLTQNPNPTLTTSLYLQQHSWDRKLLSWIMWSHLLKAKCIFLNLPNSYNLLFDDFTIVNVFPTFVSKQVPSGVLVVHVLMLAAFLRSSCTRLLYSALQSKMLRSTAGRSQGQSVMTGASIKRFVSISS